MDISRRSFVGTVAGAAAAGATGATGLAGRSRTSGPSGLSAPGAFAPPPLAARRLVPPPDRFDPWIEVAADALRANAATVGRLTEGRPILAVIKNNAYGLGLREVAGVLEPLDAVAGFAVVKAEAALALRDAGVRKPVLVMGLVPDEEAAELVRRDVALALGTDDGPERALRAARAAGREARVHLYLDTGLSRMGVPWHRAGPWLEAVGRAADAGGAGALRVEGTFMAFTEDPEVDPVQLRRFREAVAPAREAGVPLGRLHAASSNGVFHLPEAHLDMVRPGIALFGAYPSRWHEEREIATLRSAVRLRARVVRVERLRAGDGVSYGHNYVAERPTWIATLPVGHTDGYPRGAVEGAKVLIGERLYPVIGAVSASHTIVEVGDEETVAIGDVATLLGPDDPAIEPNAVAAATGASVYDLLMHLNPTLPRAVE